MEFVSNYRIYHVNMPVFRLSEQLSRFVQGILPERRLLQRHLQTFLLCARHIIKRMVLPLWLQKTGWTKLTRNVFVNCSWKDSVLGLGNVGEKVLNVKPKKQSVRNGSSLKIEAGNPLFVWPIPAWTWLAGSAIEPNKVINNEII